MNIGMFSTNKNSKRDKTTSSERGNRWCSRFLRCRSRPLLHVRQPNSRDSTRQELASFNEGSFRGSSWYNLLPQRSLHCTRGNPEPDCLCLGRSSAVPRKCLMAGGVCILHVHVEFSLHPFSQSLSSSTSIRKILSSRDATVMIWVFPMFTHELQCHPRFLLLQRKVGLHGLGWEAHSHAPLCCCCRRRLCRFHVSESFQERSRQPLIA